MDRRPNILLIIADQLVPFLTGAYGHPVVRTPSLDRPAEQGVRSDSAYAPCLICAPARVCLMKGGLPMDGQSLVPLLECHESEERTLVGEMHREGARSPCFSARQGRYKYIYVHNQGEQLFDPDQDREEWYDPSGDPAHATTVDRLRTVVLSEFVLDEFG
jgi:arylsulfatase A-like enzyme